MKESLEVSDSVSRGADIAERVREQVDVLPLTNPQAQIYLALHAFPSDPDAMTKWLEEDAFGVSLASTFRAYIEDNARTPAELEVRVKDDKALDVLLEAVRGHALGQTVH